MTELSEALGDARRAVGVSLSALSQRTHYSKALLGHLETGRRTIRPEHVTAYEEALGLRIDVGSDRVGAADADLVRQAADLVTAAGLRHGGLPIIEMANAQWKFATHLLSRPMTDSVRRTVVSHTARVTDRLAWSLADAGQTRRATATYRKALDLASEDVHLQTVVSVDLANHYTAICMPMEGLALLDSLRPTSPIAEFTVHAARAKAFGTLGEWDQTLRFIGRADAAYGRLELESLPDTYRPYVSGHEAHADSWAGAALVLLANNGHANAAPRAAERLSKALALFGPDRARAVARCRARLTALPG